MKKYKFPLGAVLRIRTTARDEAARAAADAEREASIAQDALVRAREQYVARVVPNGGVISTHHLLSQRLVHELGAEAVLEADERASIAEAELLGKRAALVAAASAVRALEELESRGRAAHRTAVQKHEAKQVDDLVVSRHGRGEEKP